MKQRVLLKGSPGLDLLNRISSLDIPALKTAELRTGLILNPAGKILSLFEATRITEDSLELQFEDGFLQLLEHYTFSETYTLTPLTSNPSPATPELDRILRLTPREGREFKPDGETNPLEVNLRSAISDQKGCYPGQEVIEKIISLGSPARRLCLLKEVTPGSSAVPSSPATLPLPAPLLSQDGADAGHLTSFSEGHALGVIKRIFLKPGTRLQAGAFEFELIEVAP